MIHWHELVDTAGVDELTAHSQQVPCLIFKHSTRCSISAVAKMRLEQDWDIEPTAVKPFFLDLIAYRQVSNHIAEHFDVHHESPQVLLIYRGECIYEESHLDIRVAEIQDQIAATGG